MPKDKVKGRGATPQAKLARVIAPGLGMLLGGLPAQVRLSAREQQRPKPFVPRRGKRRGR
jgi:hypothetical protein